MTGVIPGQWLRWKAGASTGCTASPAGAAMPLSDGPCWHFRQEWHRRRKRSPPHVMRKMCRMYFLCRPCFRRRNSLRYIRTVGGIAESSQAFGTVPCLRPNQAAPLMHAR